MPITRAEYVASSCVRRYSGVNLALLRIRNAEGRRDSTQVSCTVNITSFLSAQVTHKQQVSTCPSASRALGMALRPVGLFLGA